MKILKAAILIFLLSSFSLASEEIRAGLTADTNKVLIGVPINLKIELSGPESLKFTWPDFEKQIGGLEIIDISEADTNREKSPARFSKTIRVSAFEDSTYTAGPFTFLYEREGFDTPYPVKTKSLALTFATVEVDTAGDIKDIAGPLDAPLTFSEILPYLLWGLGAATVIILIVWYIRRKDRMPQPVTKQEISVPPHEWALSELRKLNGEKLLEQSKFKAHYSRLSEILRNYILLRFDINAPEKTTDEILDLLQDAGIRHEEHEMLKQVLSLSDLVKFAKFKPSTEKSDKAYSDSEEFVKNTAFAEKPKIEIENLDKENENSAEVKSGKGEKSDDASS
jgi:hypothetical protein